MGQHLIRVRSLSFEGRNMASALGAACQQRSASFSAQGEAMGAGHIRVRLRWSGFAGGEERETTLPAQPRLRPPPSAACAPASRRPFPTWPGSVTLAAVVDLRGPVAPGLSGGGVVAAASLPPLSCLWLVPLSPGGRPGPRIKVTASCAGSFTLGSSVKNVRLRGLVRSERWSSVKVPGAM